MPTDADERARSQTCPRHYFSPGSAPGCFADRRGEAAPAVCEYTPWTREFLQIDAQGFERRRLQSLIGAGVVGPGIGRSETAPAIRQRDFIGRLHPRQRLP